MREIEQIGDYSKGVITSIDSIDIPKEACVLASNMEPIEGYLSPLKEPSTVTSTAGKGLSIKDFGVAVKTSTTKSLVCQDGNDIKYGKTSTTFANTLTTLEAGQTGIDYISYNREVRIAKQVTDTKLFRHSDFQWFGLKDASVTIEKYNANEYDLGYMTYFRGTPTQNMTVYIPVFSIGSIATGNTVNLDNSLELFAILTAINAASVTPKKLVLLNGVDAPEVLPIASIDPDAPNIIITGTITLTSPIKCFIYAGSSYNGNPVVVTKTVTDEVATYLTYWTESYNRDIGSGIYLWTRGAYEDTADIGVVNADRVLNMKCTITLQPYIYEDAELTSSDANIDLIVLQSGGTTGYFATGTTYKYRWSLIYDGVQESPLSLGSSPITGSDDDSVAVTIRLLTPYSISKRVTGINIYRSELKSGISTFYRLVTSFDCILKDTGFASTSANNTHNCIEFTYSDSGSWGASYEAITGMSEEITTTTPFYKYGLHSYNRLLTIVNTVSDEEELTKSLLISEPFKFDMFNWDVNKIVLPSIPKGLGYFRDKVYVFGDNVVWKCNIETLAIEDTYTGYQLLDNRSILTTDMGMFFATTTGIFIVDGTNITELSYPIRDTNGVNSGIRNSCKAWDYNTTTSRVFLHYQQDKNQILVFDTYTETGWIYNLRYKSWWYIDFGTPSTLGSSALIVDELGSMFYSTGAAIKKLFAGTNYAAFTWISKLFSNDTVSQKKTLYKVKHNSEGYSSSLTIYVDNGSSATLTVDANGEVTNVKNVYKSLQLKFTSTSTATKRMVKDIELIYRRMKGLR